MVQPPPREQNEPKMRSFANVTPSSSGGGARDVRNTPSARSTNTQGRPRSTDRSAITNNTSPAQQQPRKLMDSPRATALHQKQQETALQEAPPATEPLLLNLPPSLLPHWCALMILSALCLAAVAAGTPLTMSSSTAVTGESSHYEDMQMAMAISTLSLMLCFVAAACYLLIPASFVGTLYEVTVIGLNIVMWSGCLPIIMHPQKGLAVQGPSIVNGNLFVLSWLSFLMSWVVLKHVVEQLYVMDQARGGNLAYLTPSREGYPPLIPMTRSRLVHIGLLLSNLVVLVASARDYKQQVCNESGNQLCWRLTFIVSLSVISLVGLFVAWAVFFLWKRNNSGDGNSSPTSPAFRLFLSGLLALIWFVATSVGTFGQHAPAHSLGNLFLGVWISLVLSLFLVKKTLLEFLFARQSHTTQMRSTKHKSSTNASSSNKKKNRIPGLVQDDTVDEEEEPSTPEISTRATDDFERSNPVTPVLITPKASDRKAPRSTNTHSTIAMSLEESFEKNEIHGGSMRIIRKVTDEVKAEKEDGEDEASVQTACRGSATRGASQGVSTPNTSNRSMQSSRITGSGGSGSHQRVAVPEKQRPPRPTSIPYASADRSVDYYDHNGLSTSAVTTPIDNRTAATGRDSDVLVDPAFF